MGHGLELNDTMFSAREVPWHGLGTVVAEALTAERAIVEAGLDWEVVLAPAFAAVDGNILPTKAYFPTAVIDGKQEFIGNATRVVSDKYEVFNNRDAFSFLDTLVDEGLRYETAGSLRNRAWVWMTAKLPQQVLVGGADAHDVYLLLSNSHDGTKAVRVDVTPVRVVCQNTLNLAWGESRQSWSARHLSSIEGRISEARETLALSFDYLDDWKLQSELLLSQVFTTKDMAAFTEKLIPETRDAEKTRTAITTLFAESPTIKGTIAEGNKWGALNAVGEWYDHVRFAGDDGRQTESSQALGSWEGVGARTRNKAAKLLLA